jgi:hypothetical protein
MNESKHTPEKCKSCAITKCPHWCDYYLYADEIAASEAEHTEARAAIAKAEV